MKRYIHLIVVGMLFFGVGIAFGEVVDETNDAEAIAKAQIPDRPMRDDANLQAIQTAFDISDPRANIRRFPYDPDITYKIRLREYMGSTIVLPEKEEIIGYSLFDKHNFTFVPLSDKNPSLTNVFDVYGKYHGADTNLVVHGKSGNIYSFYLRNDSVKSPHMPNLVTFIESGETTEEITLVAATQEPTKENSEVGQEGGIQAQNQVLQDAQDTQEPDYLRALPIKVAPGKINHRYVFKGGDKKIRPLRVFDDGHFTFFQFGKENLDEVQTLPTLYRVVEGYDTPVNTRVAGGFLVGEILSEKWTLRSGNTYYCIWRDHD